ncbi:MAG: TldD/PmbA family protein [Chloroflexi bacterium]|nr:TldD/PmbA family protein [Chloroflexota bacterium]
MLGGERLRRVATAVIDASPADQTEVVITSAESSLTRFANSTIHQNVFEASIEVRVRAVVGHRTGVVTTNQLDDRSLVGAAREAYESARMAPENPEFLGLPGPEPIPAVSAFREATAEYTPEQRARDVKRICDLARGHGVEAFGAWSTGASEIAVANSRGVWAYAPRSHAALKLVAMAESGTGYAERTGLDASAIDVDGAGREAVDKAVRSCNPVEVPPGAYTVVLEPYAVGTMIDYLAYMGLGALAVQEGRSFMCGKLGQRLVGENITLWDDGLDPAGVPMAFDFEGVPKRRVIFFEHGVAKDVVYDSYTAGREGKHSTGHALPAGTGAGPLPLNLFLATGDADEQDLLAGVQRGLWITRFHYVNVVHPTLTILTGMTRDGTFLIEGGEVTRPVRNLRFTQSVLTALSQVERIGRERRVLQDDLGATCVPALRIAGFEFTSVTQF